MATMYAHIYLSVFSFFKRWFPEIDRPSSGLAFSGPGHV
jgi:hypothetical protein